MDIIAKFLIFAEATSLQGSDAYTCTDGHVCCDGVGKMTDIVEIVTAPDTVNVIKRLTESMVMVTVDQEVSGRAVAVVIVAALDVP